MKRALAEGGLDAGVVVELELRRRRRGGGVAPRLVEIGPDEARDPRRLSLHAYPTSMSAFAGGSS